MDGGHHEEPWRLEISHQVLEAAAADEGARARSVGPWVLVRNVSICGMALDLGSWDAAVECHEVNSVTEFVDRLVAVERLYQTLAVDKDNSTVLV